MEEAIQSKEHMTGFFTNILDRITEPEFLYAAAMAAAFVASCAIIIAVAMILVRIMSLKRLKTYPSNNGNRVDIESLSVPTLQVPTPHPHMVTILQPVPKLVELPAQVNHNNDIAEAITAQILNKPQPNRT